MTANAYASELRATLRDASLVPGAASSIIRADFVPTTKLDIAFESKSVILGNFFRSGECRKEPKISFAPEQGHIAASYVLILTDPDAPTPEDPKFAFWRHWVVANVRPPGGFGEVLTAYLGPGPKDDSNPHRYLFLLYRTPPGWQLSKVDVGGEEFAERRSFQLADFVRTHGLELVAMNWMTCAGDGWQA